MTEAEYGSWYAEAVRGYAEDWIARGMPEEAARTKSATDHENMLPAGAATPGVSFSVLEAAGEPVGHIWVAPSGRARTSSTSGSTRPTGAAGTAAT